VKRTRLAIGVIVLLAPCVGAELVPLVEQDLLPAVDDTPSCACVIDRGAEGSDVLVIGYDGGYLMTFQRGGGRSATPSPVRLAGSGPVESAAGVLFPNGAGSGANHAILAIQGRTVSAVSFEREGVIGSCILPPPVGVYRLAGLGVAKALAYDERSVWLLALGGTDSRWDIRAEKALSAAEGLRVTERGGVAIVVADGRMHRVTSQGDSALGDIPLAGTARGGPFTCTERLVAVPDSADPSALRLLASAGDGRWSSKVVPLPGPLTLLVALTDSTVLAGGVTADMTGWVAAIAASGAVLATGAHAAPPAYACVMDGFVALHGSDGNLSVLHPRLESLWDQASRFIAPIALLPLDYDGDGFDDVALVGTRTVISSKDETDRLRKYLRKPDIMAGARLVRNPLTGAERYEREETHAEVLLSRGAALAELSGDRERSARDTLKAGDDEAAVELLCESRAAAAAIGDRERVAELTKMLGQWTSRGRRTLSTAVLAAVLAAAGLFYAFGCARGAIRVGVTAACAVALCAVAILGWRLFGSLAWTPLLVVGGIAPLGAAAVRALRSQAVSRPRPGAPVDELREAVAQLRHAVDDDLRAVGRAVTDAPRKNVTAIAALAEDMRRSFDTPDQYEALLERMRVRGETFRTIVAPHLERIVGLSRRARFVTEDAGRMRAAGARIAAALDTVLAGGATDRSVLEAALKAMPDGRRELVAAAERAWNEIEATPGCSVVSVFEYVAREKQDELKEMGVGLAQGFELRPGMDAIRMRHGELYFIVENLFTNALRAMQTTKRREIRVELRSDGVACALRFSDTGEGMTQERAAEIMTEHPGDDGGGTGIPGTLRIARRCGGDFHVERTEVGAGTTFVLTVPHWSPGTGGQN
jgi:signal transduction histidine kinase